MKGLKRKTCSAAPCREALSFRPALKREPGDGGFFRSGPALQSVDPDLPAIQPMKTGPGFQFMVNADLLKLFPGLKPVL